LGPNNPDLAAPLANLASLYSDVGMYAESEPYYLRALGIYENQLGEDHPSVSKYGLYNLAMLHVAMNQADQAVREFDRSRRIVRKQAAQVLPLLAPQEQLDFLDRVDSMNFHAAMSLGLDYSEDPSIAAFTASWLANGKAVAQETLTERARLEQDIGNPKLQPIVKRLQRYVRI